MSLHGDLSCVACFFSRWRPKVERVDHPKTPFLRQRRASYFALVTALLGLGQLPSFKRILGGRASPKLVMRRDCYWNTCWLVVWGLISLVLLLASQRPALLCTRRFHSLPCFVFRLVCGYFSLLEPQVTRNYDLIISPPDIRSRFAKTGFQTSGKASTASEKPLIRRSSQGYSRDMLTQRVGNGFFGFWALMKTRDLWGLKV
jgi:hypothetical protein